MDVNQCIVDAGASIGYTELRGFQLETLKKIAENENVFLTSPTGSGKSVVFEVAPQMFVNLGFENTLIIVVSPLVALMETQVEKLNDKGVAAQYMTGVKDTLHASTRVIVASPETLLGEFREVLIANCDRIKCLFIDEAHSILTYGKVTKKKSGKKTAYRPSYNKLCDIKAMCGNCTTVCMTATATATMINSIAKSVGIYNYCKILSPVVRKNIMYSVLQTTIGHDVNTGSIGSMFQWLVDELKKDSVLTPRTLIFCKQISQISTIWEYLTHELGLNNMYNNEPLVDMYHMSTDDATKERIRKSVMTVGGTCRVIICSTSFSMGIDMKGVQRVVHLGPAMDLVSYVQETGRSGRDVEQAYSITILYKRSTTVCSKEMRTYVKSLECRRAQLSEIFEEDCSEPTLHNCCDNCVAKCKCENCPPNPWINLKHNIDYLEGSSSSSTGSSISSSSDNSDTGAVSKRPVVVYSSDSE